MKYRTDFKLEVVPLFELVSSTLQAALSRTECASELIVHSDQGRRYKI